VSSDRRGTSGYRAPEFFDETPTFNNKLDIWSMGCILYELVVGQKAFRTDQAVFSYRQNASSMINVPFESQAFDTDSREKFTQSICSMLQITSTQRPSAPVLLRTFVQYSRPLIYEPTPAEELQPWQWSEIQAICEAIRRSRGEGGLGWEEFAQIQVETGRVRRNAEVAIIVPNERQREAKRVAEIQKLRTDEFGIYIRKPSTGMTVWFIIDSRTTIEELRRKYEDDQGWLNPWFHFCYAGSRVQNDERSVAECGIPNCSVLDLVPRSYWVSACEY
jgi:hypothetical protein